LEIADSIADKILKVKKIFKKKLLYQKKRDIVNTVNLKEACYETIFDDDGHCAHRFILRPAA